MVCRTRARLESDASVGKRKTWTRANGRQSPAARLGRGGRPFVAARPSAFRDGRESNGVSGEFTLPAPITAGLRSKVPLNPVAVTVTRRVFVVGIQCVWKSWEHTGGKRASSCGAFEASLFRTRLVAGSRGVGIANEAPDRDHVTVREDSRLFWAGPIAGALAAMRRRGERLRTFDYFNAACG
jgi:hypothetical protein